MPSDGGAVREVRLCTRADCISMWSSPAGGEKYVDGDGELVRGAWWSSRRVV